MDRETPPKGKGWVWREGRGDTPGRWVRRLTTYLDADLDRRLRDHAHANEAELGDVVVEALRRHLDAL